MDWSFKLCRAFLLLCLTLSALPLRADEQMRSDDKPAVADDAVIPAVGRADDKESPDQSHVVRIAAEEDLGGAESAADSSNRENPPVAAVSDGVRIGRLQRSIEKDKQQLESLHSDLKSAEEEFEKAGQIFNKVDGRLNETKTKLAEAEGAEQSEKAATLATELQDRQEKWTLCKERFDLSIQAKKSLQQQVGALKEKIEQDAAALAKLSGIEARDAPAELPKADTPPESPEPAKQTSPDTAEPAGKSESSPIPEEKNPPVHNEIAKATPAIATKASILTRPSDAPQDNPSSADVQEARSEASRHDAAANDAREEVAAIEKRQQSLDKNIELEQQLRDAARKQADNAVRVAQEFHEDYRAKSEANAPPEELSKIGQRIQSAEIRLDKARDEVKRRTERLDDLQAQRHTLMSDRIAALEQADARQLAADEARRKVQALENPFSQRNLLRWAFRHAPNILVILVGFVVLRLIVKVICRRVVVLMTHRGEGTRKERENRAETIVSVFHNAATVLCYSGSTLMILEECGVPVGPLLGGAAVIGLAVAFGSQNLIRDYFYGFVILLENQYGINDIVKIGEITGQVERITLRMTVVRDFDGVNFIPNGRIESVKNLTHGWSRAVLDISVAYKEDLDRVMDVLMELGRELRKDPKFDDLILEDPTMLGVEQLGDSSVVIKMFLKTKPLEQWQVKREMLRRVKKRFDELAIEIPYPQRVVNHRYLAAEEGSDDEAQAERWQQRKSA